jgi:hypothetical protein
MFQDADFWQAWIDRWQELRRREFSAFALNQLIDALTGQLREAQAREAARWPGFTSPRGGSYQAEIDRMKNWLSNRVDFMDTNFLAPPRFSQPGSQIQPGTRIFLTTAPGATVYYTLDGSDPRSPGGQVASKAQRYEGGLVLDRTATVLARAYNSAHRNLTGANNPPLSSPWSGPVQARFSLETSPDEGDLVVSELNYHPAEPSASELALNSRFTAEDFEFIEIKNVSRFTLDLFHLRFSEGVQFRFPTSNVVRLEPGALVLLVRNLDAFRARYGERTNIAGVYAGNLDDAGEKLEVRDITGEPIFSFVYGDRWWPATDGHGFTLVSSGSAPLDSSLPKSWRASAGLGGSPGSEDPSPPGIPGVLVNEALSHTDPPQLDAIELFNPTAEPADIAGWYLSDEFDKPRKYRFPEGTVLLPGGFLTVTEAQFNADPTAPTSFLLSSRGDSVQLFSADAAGRLTGYVHGFAFGAAANGVSFGRHTTLAGAEHFVAQARFTLGLPNAGPSVGPVVVSEIMYRPPDVALSTNRYDDDLNEFIELHNLSAHALPLFDPAHPTNTWRLRGGVDFDFPTNVAIASRGFLLLVGFDPVLEPGVSATFRAKYAVPAAVAVLGPFRGKLDNSRDDVRLLQPDAPEPAPNPNAGDVPYILVDQIEYQDAAPWPEAADGGGPSLQRSPVDAFGNDSLHWLAASPTAGRPSVDAPLADADGDGLPDAWELAFGLDPRSASGDNGAQGDADGDGLSNRDEFVTGTHPRDPHSYLRVEAIRHDGGQMRIRFLAVAGKSYAVLARERVAEAPWVTLKQVEASTTTAEIEVVDDVLPLRPARFYRLVTPQAPKP